MKVYKITAEQAEDLRGVSMPNGSIYNPIKDANDNHIISKEEYLYAQIGEEIDYEPIENDL